MGAVTRRRATATAKTRTARASDAWHCSAATLKLENYMYGGAAHFIHRWCPEAGLRFRPPASSSLFSADMQPHAHNMLVFQTFWFESEVTEVIEAPSPDPDSSDRCLSPGLATTRTFIHDSAI